MSFPKQTLHMCSHNSLLEEMCDTTGKGLLGTFAWFLPPDFDPCAFSFFFDFALPLFTVRIVAIRMTICWVLWAPQWVSDSEVGLFFFFFCLLGLHLWHMEVPRPGVQLELQLTAYTTATATSDLSGICNLHHSSHQCQILNLLSKARNWTHSLMVPCQIHFCCTVTGTPEVSLRDSHTTTVCICQKL